MKFYETSFEEYFLSTLSFDFNPSLSSLFNSFYNLSQRSVDKLRIHGDGVGLNTLNSHDCNEGAFSTDSRYANLRKLSHFSERTLDKLTCHFDSVSVNTLNFSLFNTHNPSFTSPYSTHCNERAFSNDSPSSNVPPFYNLSERCLHNFNFHSDSLSANLLNSDIHTPTLNNLPLHTTPHSSYSYTHIIQPFYSHNSYYYTLSFFNLLIFGPHSSGKYSRALHIIQRYSPSSLKYNKKIFFQNDKFNFYFHISDIHYEIDMSLLGCNSKLIWNDLFFHLFDVISMNPFKKGIILCKNFDSIHNELLEIFYSYMQQHNHNMSNVSISFIIITEQISFIPNNILNICNIISVPKPDLTQYENILRRSIAKKFSKFPPMDAENSALPERSGDKPLNLSALRSDKLKLDFDSISVNTLNSTSLQSGDSNDFSEKNTGSLKNIFPKSPLEKTCSSKNKKEPKQKTRVSSKNKI